MKVSVCITVYNEENSIRKLLDSLLRQSKKPDEIVIVDAESEDKTVQIIRHLQKKDKRIKLLIQKCSRAEGRNLSVEIAKNSIIAMTDADCIAGKNWLKRILAPFKHKDVDIVAGFYKMIAKNEFQEAEKIYLGVIPSKFDVNFLPSTRSIAFRKKTWLEIGGFPEYLDDTAEDTIFNYQALLSDKNITRVKSAVVEWRIPQDYKGFIKKIFSYAKGDVVSKLFWHPTKKLASHNIKVLLVYIRYLIALLLLVNKHFLIVLILFLAYVCWSFRKVYIYSNSVKVGLWGAILQLSVDGAVMAGFASGLISRKND